MANVTHTADDDYIIHLAYSETTNSGWKWKVANNATTPIVLLEVDTHGGMTLPTGYLIADNVTRFTNTSSGDLIQFKRKGTTYIAIASDGMTDASYAGARLHHASGDPGGPTEGDCFWKVDGGGSHTFRVYADGGWMDISTSTC